MKELTFSKDLQILQVIPFAVSLSHLNFFFHSRINLSTGMVVVPLIFQHQFSFFVYSYRSYRLLLDSFNPSDLTDKLIALRASS